jgi:hypothetical protein
MICPYCGIGVKVEWNEEVHYRDDSSLDAYALLGCFCPACEEFIVRLKHSLEFNEGNINYPSELDEDQVDLDVQIYPTHTSTHKLDESIPTKYKTIFAEAEATLNTSPRASATLSRFLLQLILHDHLNIKKRNLEEEIIAIEKLPDMTSSLINKLHILRRVANFGAHPKKSTHSNEIVDVEPGEADLILKVLIEFFDFLFVKPRQQEQFMEEIKTKFNITL